MKQLLSLSTCSAVVLVTTLVAWPATSATSPSWNPRAAAAYLDGRQAWWMTWPTAARDHGTQCVSCHTALSYALARPVLRRQLGESDAPSAERQMLEHVTTRVRLWKDVEPYYPDQTRGLPKTSESRGSEAVFNALILAARDAGSGSALSDDARRAFDNLWALQFTAGDQKGGWAWLNFQNEPWEAPGSEYFGASLAAIAIGTAPGDYGATPAIQDRVRMLAAYLGRSVEKAHLLNRAMILWAASKIPGVLAPEQRRRIVDDLLGKQQSDGGWSTAALVGDWKRHDSTPQKTSSDGYATGLVAFALQQAGSTPDDPRIDRALTWLVQHQDRAMGLWTAPSLNKERDPATDIGKFMSDAATAYAVLALAPSTRR
jgi:squalene-hopene/tetraprenyl-beta-curcumene cyclase